MFSNMTSTNFTRWTVQAISLQYTASGLHATQQPIFLKRDKRKPLVTFLSLDPFLILMFWIMTIFFSAKASARSWRTGCRTSANCACPSCSSSSASCFFKISFKTGNSVQSKNWQVSRAYRLTDTYQYGHCGPSIIIYSVKFTISCR